MGDLAKAELYVAGAYLMDYSGFFDNHFGSPIIPMRAYQGMNIADAYNDRNLNFDYYNTDIPYGYPGHHGLVSGNRAFGSISSPPSELLIAKTWEDGEHIVATGSDYWYYPYPDLLDEPFFRYTIKLHDKLLDKDVFMGVVEETRIGHGFAVWKRHAFGIRDNITEANLIDFENNDRAMDWKRCFEFDDYTFARTTCISKLWINTALYAFEFEGATNPSSKGYSQSVAIPTTMLSFQFKYKDRYNEWTGNDSTIASYDYYLLYGAASRYTLPDLMYEIPPEPEPTRKGVYPGMPTSNIPLRDTFGDLNSRKAIRIYDESNNEQNCMFLNNPIGTIPYSYIDFTESGTLKIRNQDYHSFTHFAGLGLNNENQYPLIYRVTERKVIARDVIEVWYEIDGRKTFFQYYGITTYNPIITRSTNPTGYEPFKHDTAMLTGKVINNNYVLRSSISPNYLVRVVDKYGRVKSYLMTETGLIAFRLGVSNHVLQKQLVNQIISINIVPSDIASASTFTKTPVDSIEFSILDEDGTIGVAEISVSCNELTVNHSSNSTTPDSYIEVNLSGSYHNINDFSEMSGVFNMFVPYYGYFTLDEQEILLIANNSGPTLRYYLDIEGGNVAVQVFANGKRGKMHTFVPMPSTTIACRDLEAIRYANAAQENSVSISTNQGIKSIVTSAGAGALTGGAAGAAVGGIGAIPGAIAGAAMGAAGAAVNMAFSMDALKQTNAVEMDHIINSLVQDNIIGSGTISTTCRCIFISELIPEKSVSMAKYYSVVGYPIDKPWIDVGAVDGACYWLEFNWATVKAQYGAIDQKVLNQAILDLQQPVIYNYTPKN